ncbi:MAG TPA: DUF1707 domain-containing protein [Dermatophilaceae bacterium]|nr:DUF1707 domain-containing protein [Dermatophilaceae bacterium]
MSDENREMAGPHDGVGNSTRVGSAERDEAVALLAEHWHAGRLDPSEHELRVTRARAAVTQADLDVLFTDLPQPVPVAPPPAGSGSPGPVSASGGGGFLEGKRETIIALTPFAALILFFVTHSWLWFLMVPVMGILLFGPGGKRNQPGRERT